MDLQVTLAAIGERPVLRNLLTDCLVELSRYGEVNLAYPYFDAYWEAGERRWPYLIRQGSHTVGFALVNTLSPSGRGTDFAMAEFYIAPEVRNAGVGRAAAAAVIGRHRGRGSSASWCRTPLPGASGRQPSRPPGPARSRARAGPATRSIASGSNSGHKHQRLAAAATGKLTRWRSRPSERRRGTAEPTS